RAAENEGKHLGARKPHRREHRMLTVIAKQGAASLGPGPNQAHLPPDFAQALIAQPRLPDSRRFHERISMSSRRISESTSETDRMPSTWSRRPCNSIASSSLNRPERSFAS